MKYAPGGQIYNNVASNKAIDWNRWETIVHGNHKNMSELIIWIPGSIPYNHNNTKNNNVFLVRVSESRKHRKRRSENEMWKKEKISAFI